MQGSDKEEEASSQRADQVDDESSAAPPAKYAKLKGLPFNLSDPRQSSKHFYSTVLGSASPHHLRHVVHRLATAIRQALAFLILDVLLSWPYFNCAFQCAFYQKATRYFACRRMQPILRRQRMAVL